MSATTYGTFHVVRKNLYIIGARGFGRETAVWLPTWPGFADQYVIKGFLDDKADALDGFGGYPPIVSSVEDFRPGERDVFICALGAVEWRRKYIGIMLSKGGVFDTFVYPLAYVRAREIGAGTFIVGTADISPDVSIGDHVLCHSNVVIGHDVKIGDYAVLENGVFCGGYSEIGPGATLHTRSTILPHKAIGADATVGACSCVARNVKKASVVFGVPAVRIDE